jgi:DNA-binding NarL/FixJ family response regulator
MLDLDRDTTRTTAQLSVSSATMPNPLSKRERDILSAIAEGQNSREISERLSLTAQAFSNYLTNILQKVGARNRGQAAALALRNGWLDDVDI